MRKWAKIDLQVGDRGNGRVGLEFVKTISSWHFFLSTKTLNTFLLSPKSVWNVFPPSHFLSHDTQFKLSLTLTGRCKNLLLLQNPFWLHSFFRLLSYLFKVLQWLIIAIQVKDKVPSWAVCLMPTTAAQELSELQPHWPYFSPMIQVKWIYICFIPMPS